MQPSPGELRRSLLPVTKIRQFIDPFYPEIQTMNLTLQLQTQRQRAAGYGKLAGAYVIACRRVLGSTEVLADRRLQLPRDRWHGNRFNLTHICAIVWAGFVSISWLRNRAISDECPTLTALDSTRDLN